MYIHNKISVSSGTRLHNNGKSPILAGKSTIVILYIVKLYDTNFYRPSDMYFRHVFSRVLKIYIHVFKCILYTCLNYPTNHYIPG